MILSLTSIPVLGGSDQECQAVRVGAGGVGSPASLAESYAGVGSCWAIAGAFLKISLALATFLAVFIG